ncbi:hypothetical protein H310_09510 [Aphanomyces invadans]|uniref:Uncharacterized protein n=1 Tax=Aphanomyces invadans TaxID=157072 RepID=A0A024TUE2_9STRA|nr:hypothetical protein H310_09510 [Aphanomyces invadans]ETV97614.1 hypothetical protein H310_09510 [Aphanomyces invadans]|eukprot:XP_008873823.1 hypothetical protein H310_09510 [Aphanomyces invadans]
MLCLSVCITKRIQRRHAASSAPHKGDFTFTYERPLAATTTFDVPIKLDEPTTVNWAVGFSAFSNYHDIQ